MMGANHVVARLAFNHGVDVVTAVTFRSGVTATVVTALVLVCRVPLRLSARQRRALPAIGLLVAVQSLCRYASVARLPVALALDVLGVVGNSAIMNVEPIFVLVLATVLWLARTPPPRH
jgi:drug/metabolite transporter (DMT)-like permease